MIWGQCNLGTVCASPLLLLSSLHPLQAQRLMFLYSWHRVQAQFWPSLNPHCQEMPIYPCCLGTPLILPHQYHIISLPTYTCRKPKERRQECGTELSLQSQGATRKWNGSSKCFHILEQHHFIWNCNRYFVSSELTVKQNPFLFMNTVLKGDRNGHLSKEKLPNKEENEIDILTSPPPTHFYRENPSSQTSVVLPWTPTLQHPAPAGSNPATSATTEILCTHTCLCMYYTRTYKYNPRGDSTVDDSS